MEILTAILASRPGRKDYEGPEVERDYEVGEFERLELFGPFDVEVRTDAKPGVHASGPEDALELLLVEQHGDRLVIGFDGEGNCGVEILVTTARLKSIRM